MERPLHSNHGVALQSILVEREPGRPVARRRLAERMGHGRDAQRRGSLALPEDAARDGLGALLRLNLASVALASELLSLPSPMALIGAADAIWHRGLRPPMTFLAHAGGPGLPRGLAAAPMALAVLIPARLRLVSGWRSAPWPRPLRPLGPERHEELGRGLERYGSAPLRADAGRRLLLRVAALNRAVLGALAAVERGALPGAVLRPNGAVVGRIELSEDAMDVLSLALPALAVPDWVGLAREIAWGDIPASSPAAHAPQPRQLPVTGSGEGRPTEDATG